MRVLLVNPSLLEANIGHYSKAVEKQRGVYPPLGLCYVASALRDNHDVRIVDCDIDRKSLEDIASISKKYNPDVVGIYTMTWTFRQVNWIVDQIKKELPDIKFVMGGPNVSSFPKLSLEYSKFDYAVLGEGEITAPQLVDTLEKDVEKDVKKMRGLIYRSKNKVVVNPQRPLIEDLDSIKFPAWDLIPLNRYFDVFTREKKFATMISSRGCPFDCTYCDRKNRMGKKWRPRSPENIIDEMGLLDSKYNIKEIMFFDDNFIIDKKRVHTLCDGIRERGLDILWECRARVDVVDKPLLESMRNAGCYRIRYGMEAGDNNVLKTLKKGITVSQIRECAKLTRDAGIEIFAYFMMGSPYETPETIEKTFKLALEIDPDFVAFSKTILLVGTELFDWAVENNQIRGGYWERYLLGGEMDPAPGISTKELPAEFLGEYVGYATKKFYTRPKYILKRLKSIRSLTQLYRQFSLGLNLIFSKLDNL